MRCYYNLKAAIRGAEDQGNRSCDAGFIYKYPGNCLFLYGKSSDSEAVLELPLW